MQKYLISLVWIVVIVSGLTGCEVSERPMSIEADAVELAEPNVVEVAAVEPTEPKIVEVLRSGSADPAVVTAVCELIYQGKFDAAGKLIEKKLVTVEAERTDANSVAGALVDIVQEYSVVGQRRKSAQESAYKEQLAELEAIRIAADANGIDDVNDISKALSVVAEVTEFAEPKQKEGLLSDSFVKQVIQKAKTKAAEFESQGKWLDAYTSCYFWLERIDEDNTEYSDYAEQLRDRAGIVASFQDSPCETRKERFRKVKRRMFV